MCLFSSPKAPERELAKVDGNRRAVGEGKTPVTTACPESWKVKMMGTNPATTTASGVLCVLVNITVFLLPCARQDKLPLLAPV